VVSRSPAVFPLWGLHYRMRRLLEGG